MDAHPPSPQLELPGWLAPADPAPAYLDVVKTQLAHKHAHKHLEEQMFETLMDEAMEVTSSGKSLVMTFAQDPRLPSLGRFLAWVMRDEARKARYYEAQQYGAEVVTQEVIAIADANDSMEDVNRSTLRINTRKWTVGVWNRARFGDIKQIDQTVHIDLSDAMSMAQERIDRARAVDATSRLIDGR
jgi:hypothetical protein